MASDCVFCRIIEGRSEASLIWRDEKCMAFMDIQPVNAGHMLVVPNAHAAYLKDMSSDDAGHLMRVAHQLAGGLRASELRVEGVNLFLADGEAAMQEVFHVHLYVFPRYEGDGFGLQFSEDYFDLPPRQELESAARSIRAALSNHEDLAEEVES